MFSIGSLGRGGSYAQVENINVSDVNFDGTTNGARIKTWEVRNNQALNLLPIKMIKSELSIVCVVTEIKGGKWLC